MHETSIALSLLEQVRSFLPSGSTLLELSVEIGQLEHLDEDVLAGAWEVVTDATDLAGSRLVCRRVPMRVRCGACGNEYGPEEPAYLVCPKCQVARPQVLEGSGVLLRSLEVDEPGQ